MASLPDLRARGLRRRHQRQRVGVPQRRGQPLPAQQLGAPGPVRARAPRSSRSPPRPALTKGLITPTTTINDQGVYRIPNCRDETCERSNDGRKKYGAVDLRRSLTVSSDVYYYDLGARFWIEPDQYGGPEAFADQLKRWGFHQDTGIDLSGEQPRAHPVARVEEVLLRGGRSASTTGVAHRRQRQHGHRPGRRARHAAAARLRLRARSATAGTRWVPQVVPRDPRRRSPASRSARSSRSRPARSRWRPSGARPSSTASVGVTTQEGGTAVGAFSGFPNDAFPIAAKTGTAQVSGKAPTAVFGAFGPAADPHYAISVFMEESGYGGRRGRARRPPPVRRALRFGAAPARARGWRRARDRRSLPRARGRARLMAHHLRHPGTRSAPGALGRLSRNPSSPWRHVDLVLVGVRRRRRRPRAAS